MVFKPEVCEIIIGNRTAAEISRFALLQGWIKPPAPPGPTSEEITRRREHRKHYRREWMRAMRERRKIAWEAEVARCRAEGLPIPPRPNYFSVKNGLAGREGVSLPEWSD